MGSLVPILKPDVTLSLSLSSSPASHATLKPEDRGIRLIQLLLKCAHHASSGNLHRADACLSQISDLASATGDSMQRLASRFASALAIRLVKHWPGIHKALSQTQDQDLNFNWAKTLFAQLFPYLNYAYAIAARILLQSFTNERIIHVVDLGTCDSKLWIPILHSFANSPHGPPHLKLTCVSKDKATLEKLGQRLIKEAESLDLPFQFNPLNVRLRDLTVDMLKVRSGETLAFISILSLHVLLAEDDQVDVHFGAAKANNVVKDCKQMSDFLQMLSSLSPKLLYLVEQEADHNLNRLQDRFVDGLHYYSAIFDSIDATFGSGGASEERFVIEQMFGKEIENIVACEGLERYERHERYGNWVVRLARAGFKPLRLWYDSDDEAKQIIDAFGKDGYKVACVKTSLMICWHERPLYSIMAWCC